MVEHLRGHGPRIRRQPRFVLGTFSYAKLPMVQDLESAVDAMVQHDLIAALAGDDDARAAVRARRATSVTPADPNHVPPADEFLVLDADASQNYAINSVLAGQDLVIKGPPGTGKSQTIANLIATLIARDKRVLFVAEKRAAIDAVLRRLDQVGLGDLVLDLHGGGGGRRRVAQGLAEALTTNATIALGDYSRDHHLLQSRRDDLNARVEALHGIRDPWGLSLYEAEARILALSSATATKVRFRGQVLERLSREAHDQVREHLRSYAGLGGLTLSKSTSPWGGASITSTEEAREAQQLVERVRDHTLPTALDSLREAAERTGLKAPTTIRGWADRLELWSQVRETLAVFDGEVFGEPLDELQSVLAPLGAGGPRRAGATLTSGAFRSARARIKAHLRDGIKLRPTELLAATDDAHARRDRWSEMAVDGGEPAAPENLDDLSSTYGQLKSELSELERVLGRDTLDRPAEELLSYLEALLADGQTLSRLPELSRLRTALESAGVTDVLADCAARSLHTTSALEVFEHAWLWSIVDEIRLRDPLVGAFDGEAHLRTVAECREVDRRHIETTAQRVRRLVAEAATRAQDDYEAEGALIRDQAARKRGHLSMRQLFSAAPHVMTALKPCWAMSPLVVSQMLPADQQYFDVVIFDEASQVRPADAIPAILRGKRVLVAGDEHQLPPTDFFTGAAVDDDTMMEGRIVVDAGFESILEALLPFLDFRMLSWHYRSRDERLIAFSNVYFYDRGLTTFPGVVGPRCIRHELVPFVGGEVESETSRAAEVQRVVDLILEHADERPGESLGVIAMGIKHADRIGETLRRALAERERTESDLDDFFNEGRKERFFIKNLENVQGDERDAIILSIGYGKNADGRLLYRFGPLNNDGGERRLNVAITRARSRMTLVSSFAFADMEPGRSTKRGVELMRCYLQYAESNGDDLGSESREIPELNPFEIDIRDTLTRAGIPLTAQYGASGFRIDFAAQHPTEPGRMVLAIECDGATYHSSQTARDRDRLRQEQLERLGWTFHRIWSQDWFDDKERETEKAVAAYHQALARADRFEHPTLANAAPNDSLIASEMPTVRPARGPRPNVPHHRAISDYGLEELRALVRWVKSDTLLRTQDELLGEVITELGFQKRGKRIVAAITAAIQAEAKTA